MTLRVDTEQRIRYTVRKFEDNKEVSRGSIIIDYKPNGKPAGLVEDVWTHEDYRKKGFASIIMEELIKIAKMLQCYKVVLMCKDEHIAFYSKLGFKTNQNSMRLDI